ncbi:MAG: hypothetical protein KDB80_00670, partial [Planctomycetes bacterium]|nr:hypothetical protein [Planctomycetota bacterium]
MRGVGRSLFPVGLYASLLIALLGLLRPQLVAPLDSTLSAVAALPFRAYGEALPRPVQASSGEAERSLLRSAAFWERTVAAELPRRPVELGPEWRPESCRVRRHDAAVGTLEPARTWQGVANCERFVTVGDSLVGFLGTTGANDEFAVVDLFARVGAARSTEMRGV